MAAQPQVRRRRQRSEARHSIAAILKAATEALNANPRASVDEIARVAEVSRQTVYAHFPTREALMDAVTEQATVEVTAAFDAARFDESRPVTALVQLLEAGWQITARYPFLWNLQAVTQDEDARGHAPVLGRMLELIRRGQDSGDLDSTLSADWLITASLAIGRAAQEDVTAGRMTIEEATRAVHHTFLRLLGIEDSPQ